MIRPRDLAVPVLAAAGAGVGLWQLWWSTGYPAGSFARGLAGHGPDPLAWPRFVACWLPVTHVLFAVGYVGLSRAAPASGLRGRLMADQLTLVMPAGLAVALLALGGTGPWRSAIGLAYVGWVALKTALFLDALWRRAPAWLDRPRAAAGAMFLAAFVPMVALDGYVATRISSTGDEPYYLLQAHSVLHDGDLDLANNFARRDYLPFYWDTLDTTAHMTRTPDGRLYSRAHIGLQPILLAPGYWVGGRLGAMVTTSALGSAALALAFGLARRLGAAPRSAFLAWLGVAFSVPVLSLAGSPWPEMPAALLTGVAATLLLGPRPTPRVHAGVALCLGALFTLKVRFLVSIAALAPGALRRATWRALGALGLGAAALLAAGLLYDAAVSGGLFFRHMRTAGAPGLVFWLVYTALVPIVHWRGLLGLLLDQEHGVLLVAPVFALALAGLVVLARGRRWRALLVVGGPFVATWYLAGGFLIRGVPMWGGGFSPPARYLASTLVLLTVPMALALDRVGGRRAWAATASLFALTLGHAAVLSVWPELRYQHQVGRATVLTELAARTGLELGRFLPTYVGPGATWLWPGILACLAVVAGGLRLSRTRGGPPGREAVALGLLAGTLLAAALVAAAWRPAGGTWPAAPWRGRGGTSFHGILAVDGDGRAARAERLVWAVRGASRVELAPRLAPGTYRLALRAGAQGDDGAPALVIQAGDQPARRLVLEAAAPPAWRERDYAVEVPWRGGRLPVRIELADVSVRSPVRLAYIERLEVVRLRP